MSYRDDREALRQRAEDLAAELDAARQKLARREAELAERAERDAAEEQELAELRDRVKQLSPSESKKPEQARAVAIGAGALVIAGICAAAVAANSRSKSRAVSQAPKLELPAASVSAQTRAATEPTTPIVVPGTVTEVSGRSDVRIGDPCIVLADARPGRAAPKDLVVRCGEQELYRLSDTSGSVTSKWTWDLRPQSHSGKSRYALSWEDIGSRTGSRPQARIDSYRRKAKLWQAGGFSVEILLSPLSFAEPAPPIAGSSNPVEPVAVAVARVPLRVKKSIGLPSVAAGNACELELWQLEEPAKCRGLLRCGPQVLYGAEGTGFITCKPEGDVVSNAIDNVEANVDHDGTLIWDANTMGLSFTDGDRKLVLTSSKPQCDATGDWKGELETGPEVEPAALKLEGSAGTLTIGQKTMAVSAKLDCPWARIVLEGDGVPSLALELGPGRKTLGGTMQKGVLWLTLQ